jgi:hypothetical protein
VLTLSLVWLAGGAIVGGLVWLAALRPPLRARSRWWSPWTLLAAGALGGLAGGWLGTALFGRFFGSPAAAWVAVVVVIASPWVVARLSRDRGHKASGAAGVPGGDGPRLEQPH